MSYLCVGIAPATVSMTDGYGMRVHANPHFFIAMANVQVYEFGGGTLLAENIKSTMRFGQEKYDWLAQKASKSALSRFVTRFKWQSI
ncbi:hypothetical protein [Paenibacillus sp. NPDC058071]|uniref:hypothetical protein n=1 Tax=Paenibacillus sp. NPDC058071 TaxID=3346326 RepID=UPI0036D8FC29